LATSSFTLTSSNPLLWISTAFLITALLRAKTTQEYLPYLAHISLIGPPTPPASHEPGILYLYIYFFQPYPGNVLGPLHTWRWRLCFPSKHEEPSDMASYPRIVKYSTTLLYRFQDFKFKYCNYRVVKISERVFGRLEKITKYEIFMNL
jgi:hypothetical protein